MTDMEEQIYIPRRKVKKSKYLELKKINEEYESIIDIWGSSNGDDQKTRKIKAREILQNNPDLSQFRTVLTTQPTEAESEECEGFRYWIMKENGTLPVKKKEPILPIIEPKVEQPSELSLTEEVTLHYPKTEEEPQGKKTKVTLGNKIARFFGFSSKD